MDSKTFSCPICREKCDFLISKTYFPFCSKACHERDMISWLNGNYAIPDSSAPIMDDSDFTLDQNDLINLDDSIQLQ